MHNYLASFVGDSVEDEPFDSMFHSFCEEIDGMSDTLVMWFEELEDWRKQGLVNWSRWDGNALLVRLTDNGKEEYRRMENILERLRNA